MCLRLVVVIIVAKLPSFLRRDDSHGFEAGIALMMQGYEPSHCVSEHFGQAVTARLFEAGVALMMHFAYEPVPGRTQLLQQGFSRPPVGDRLLEFLHCDGSHTFRSRPPCELVQPPGIRSASQ